MKKVLLILVDGMRPDAIKTNPRVQKYTEGAAYTLAAKTVMPSVTLPCHVSLFHSVDPGRHGTTTNTYAPQVRPVNGLCEVLNAGGKLCTMFYSWSQLRDIVRPGSLVYSHFYAGRFQGYEKANNELTDNAIKTLKETGADFAFLYLGYPDAAGHGSGWMGEEYMQSVEQSWDCIERITDALGEDYSVIVTADHGGHDRSHGTDMPEDMTIPIIAKNCGIKPGEIQGDVSIMDIAPTIVKLLEVNPDSEWEGKSLL